MVYESLFLGSLTQYASNPRGDWFQRSARFSANGNQRPFSRWQAVGSADCIALAEAIDPDNPPRVLKLFGRTLTRQRGVTARLPR